MQLPTIVLATLFTWGECLMKHKKSLADPDGDIVRKSIATAKFQSNIPFEIIKTYEIN